MGSGDAGCGGDGGGGDVGGVPCGGVGGDGIGDGADGGGLGGAIFVTQMFSMNPVPANKKLRPPVESASPVGASEPYGKVANVRLKQAVASNVKVTERESETSSRLDDEVGLSLPVPSTVDVNVVRPSAAVPIAMVEATVVEVLNAA